MIRLCLQRAFRPVFQKSTPGVPRVAAAPRPPGSERRAPGRWMGTHRRNEPREPLNSPKRAKDFIYRLQPAERSCLLRELQSFESIAIAQETLEPSPPSAAQIRYVLLHNGIPFVGFGFLDNAIMIAAGTQIELSIGVTLGISTMAAAALGNMVSDLAGLGLAGYVEALVARLGMQGADLTPKQVDMWQTRLSSHMGKAIGVAIGCLLGMFPLLFLSDDEDEKKEKEAQAAADAASHS
ncbi:transmembrane protein 65 [Myripristis murdjan]|uniref:Transmembrane protein 65 n=1 Tax=Myripristis murdjan TaxID=586833 RepID=A0A667WPL4_9TELE|nr:transmembrane protein 65 [Myripristis murdjan]XP_029920005.1 transmembrane protein 65 [Myripristis murdjan]